MLLYGEFDAHPPINAVTETAPIMMNLVRIFVSSEIFIQPDSRVDLVYG